MKLLEKKAALPEYILDLSVPESKKYTSEPCNKTAIILDVKHLICLIEGTLPQRFSQNIWMCKTAHFTWIPQDKKEGKWKKSV